MPTENYGPAHTRELTDEDKRHIDQVPKLFAMLIHAAAENNMRPREMCAMLATLIAAAEFGAGPSIEMIGALLVRLRESMRKRVEALKAENLSEEEFEKHLAANPSRLALVRLVDPDNDEVQAIIFANHNLSADGLATLAAKSWPHNEKPIIRKVE